MLATRKNKNVFCCIPRPEKKICSDVDVTPPLSDLDKNLLRELLVIFSGDTIEFYSQHDFNGSFSDSYWKPISRFCDVWGNVEHEFVDNELEARRKKLYEVTFELASLIAKYTVPIGHGTVSVKPNMAGLTEEHMKMYRTEAKEINEQCDPFVTESESFVRYAKKRLAQ